MATGQQCPICGTERTRAGTLPCSCARQNPASSSGVRALDAGTGGSHGTHRSVARGVGTRATEPGRADGFDRPGGGRHARTTYEGPDDPGRRDSAAPSAGRGATSADVAGRDGAGRSEGTGFAASRDGRAVSGGRHAAGGAAVDSGTAGSAGLGGSTAPGGSRGLDGSVGADGPAGSGDFEPLRLRPYVSLPDADDHAARTTASTETSATASTTAHEPDGGLLGLDGPLRWTLVEEIWGPDERTKRSGSTDAAAGSEGSPAAGDPQGRGGPAEDGTAPVGTTGAAGVESAGLRPADGPDSAVLDWPGRVDGSRPGAALPGQGAPPPPGGAATASAAPTARGMFEPPRRSDFFGTQHPFDDPSSPGTDARADQGLRAGGPFAAAEPNGMDGTGSATSADGTQAKGTDDFARRGPVTGRPIGSTAVIGTLNGQGPGETGGDHATAEPDAPHDSHDPHAPHALRTPYDSHDSYDSHDAESSVPDEQVPPGARKRRLTVLAASGVAVIVTAVALGVSGVFSSDKPSQDAALPGTDAGTSAPDVSTTEPSSSRPEVDAPPASRPPSAPRTVGQAPGSGPAHAAPAPPPAAPTAGTSGSPGHTSPPGTPTSPPVLHPGDEGREVTELQLRLRQLLLYLGLANGEYTSSVENAVGNYQESRGITDDKPGIYGPATRHSLESETRTP